MGLFGLASTLCLLPLGVQTGHAEDAEIVAEIETAADPDPSKPETAEPAPPTAVPADSARLAGQRAPTQNGAVGAGEEMIQLNTRGYNYGPRPGMPDAQ